jgi:Fe-S-cluster containining protein
MPEAPLRRGFVLARATPFSYQCHACSRCCRGKIIRINPYEVARLAQVLGMSTTEVLARFTCEGGSILAMRDDQTCVFLGERGCSVHAGRPLVCRLYPLGRSKDPDGAERFAELEPVPQSEGVYGEDGTIDDFLRSQDVARHVAAADRYVEVLKRMVTALARRSDAADVHDEATQAVLRPPTAADESLLDMDAVVTRWCAEHEVEVPRDVEEKTEIHLRVLEEYSDSIATGGSPL